MVAIIIFSNTNIHGTCNQCTRRYHSKIDTRDILLIAGGVAAISLISYGLARWTGNVIYKNALKKYDALAQFQNSHGMCTEEYRYNQLKTMARSLYYDQINSSSTSLENDYPVVWLEKAATSTKNFLSCMVFSSRMQALSKKINEALKYLRNFEPFIEERRAYNEKFREQSYRNERINLEKEKVSIEREKLNHQKEQDTIVFDF